MPTSWRVPWSEPDLLESLEEGERGSSETRAALLARLGGADDVDGLSIGERDRCILQLREAVLGPRIDCEDTCPHCGDDVEFALDVRVLIDTRGTEPAPLVVAGAEIGVRALTVADLSRAAAMGGVEASRRALLQAAVDADARFDVDDLARELQEAVAQRVAAADPLSEITLALSCDACGEHWRGTIDPSTFVWRELQIWRLELLRSIDLLARTYGWTEPDVLALPSSRRRAYVELALDG